MALIDNIRNLFTPRIVELAEKRPRDMDVEVGVGGSGLTTSFNEEENRPDTIKIEDYIKMTQNDGQVAMLTKLLTYPVLSAGWQFNDDPDYEADNDSPELEFIKQCFETPPQKGGIENGMNLLMHDMLRAVTEGFRVFEKVYSVKDGKIILKKLAPRAGQTITILTDEKGGFIGVKQDISYKGRITSVKIPAEKCLLLTYQKEKEWLYGESILKPIYYHYDKKHKLYFIHYVASEMSAVKPREVKEKTGDSGYISALNKAIDAIGFKSRVTYDPTKAEIVYSEASNPQVMQGIMDMVAEHNIQMAKAIMAQFTESSTGAYGSKAMMDSSVDLFKMLLEGICTFIEDHFNMYVIPELIDYNFGSGVYPRLEFNPIRDKTLDLVTQAFTKMIEQGRVSKEVESEIVSLVSEKLNLDLTDNTIEEATQVEKEQVEPKKELNPELSEDMQGSRALYPDEEVINFAEINAKYDEAETKVVTTLTKALRKEKDEVIQKYLTAFKQKDLKGLAKVKVELAEDTYSDELKATYEDMYQFGLDQGANEIGVEKRKLNAKEKATISGAVALILMKQQADLGFRMGKVVETSVADENISNSEVVEALNKEYDSYWDSALTLTATMLTGQALNKGLLSIFGENNVEAFRYTAVLDSATTNYCRSLDGSVFDPQDPNFHKVSPPNHFNCRSRWSAITKKVETNGVPSGLEVQESIYDFKDPKILEEIESKLTILLNED